MSTQLSMNLPMKNNYHYICPLRCPSWSLSMFSILHNDISIMIIWTQAGQCSVLYCGLGPGSTRAGRSQSDAGFSTAPQVTHTHRPVLIKQAWPQGWEETRGAGGETLRATCTLHCGGGIARKFLKKTPHVLMVEHFHPTQIDVCVLAMDEKLCYLQIK